MCSFRGPVFEALTKDWKVRDVELMTFLLNTLIIVEYKCNFAQAYSLLTESLRGFNIEVEPRVF